MKGIRLVSLWLVLALGVRYSAPSAAQTPATIWIAPSQETLSCSETATLVIAAQGVVDLHRLSFGLTYDPSAIVLVEDGAARLGSALVGKGYQVTRQSVDEGIGTAWFELSLADPATVAPFSGSGELVQIDLRARSTGVSPLVLIDVALTGSDGRAIQAQVGDGIVTTACGSALSGRAYLEGRTDHSSILVSVVGTGLTANPDAGGVYVVNEVPPGRHTVLLRAAGYLDVAIEGVALAAGQCVTVPDRTLLAGDLNDDGQIDILDLVIVGSQYGSTTPHPLAADVNRDGEVDILDIVLLAKNL